MHAKHGLSYLFFVKVVDMNNPVMSEENIRENYERIERWLSHPSPGDEVIISGNTICFYKFKTFEIFQKCIW